MIQEKKYQIEAVEALVKKTIKLLEAPEDRKKLVFKAPTGSGKTVMASKMLDDLPRNRQKRVKKWPLFGLLLINYISRVI